MDALTKYATKRHLTDLLKQAQVYQNPAQKLTAAAPQMPAVTQGVVNAGAPAPTLVPPPPGKGSPAPMAAQVVKPPSY